MDFCQVNGEFLGSDYADLADFNPFNPRNPWLKNSLRLAPLLVNVVVRDRGELDLTKTEVEHIVLGTPLGSEVVKEEAGVLFRGFPVQQAGIFQDAQGAGSRCQCLGA